MRNQDNTDQMLRGKSAISSSPIKSEISTLNSFTEAKTNIYKFILLINNESAINNLVYINWSLINN